MTQKTNNANQASIQILTHFEIKSELYNVVEYDTEKQ